MAMTDDHRRKWPNCFGGTTESPIMFSKNYICSVLSRYWLLNWGDLTEIWGRAKSTPLFAPMVMTDDLLQLFSTMFGLIYYTEGNGSETNFDRVHYIWTYSFVIYNVVPSWSCGSLHWSHDGICHFYRSLRRKVNLTALY